MTKNTHSLKGFTIVELLVVIVVIGILAAIAIIAFNGVSSQASEASLKSDLRNGATQLGAENAVNGSFPATLGAANEGTGLKTSSGNTFQYSYDASGNAYCLTGFSSKAGAKSYFINSTTGVLSQGVCPGHAAPVAGDNQGVVTTQQITNGYNLGTITVDSSGLLYWGVRGYYDASIGKGTDSNGGTSQILAGTGTGFVDGTGGFGAPSPARFRDDVRIEAGPTGDIFVADKYNHAIRKMTPTGAVTTISGFSGSAGSTNGSASSASFSSPDGVALNASGTIYVADTGNNRIRRITSTGTVVSAFAGTGTAGTADGAAASAQFNGPTGLAVDAAGNIYVADTGNNLIRKITAAGVVSTIGGASVFNAPEDVAVDSAGNIFVADTGNNRIRKITPAGVVSILAGSGTAGSNDGTGIAATFDRPVGIAVTSTNVIYVIESGRSYVRELR